MTRQRAARMLANGGLLALFALVCLPAYGQITEHHVFNLGSDFGSRVVYTVRISRPGRFVARASWSGDTNALALILNGPGQVGYYQRRDGRSPLSLDFAITSGLLQRGHTWKLSVVNFSRRGPVRGTVTITFPEPPPSQPGANSGVRRRITPDGSVEVIYPDGTSRVTHPNGSVTITLANGSTRTMTSLPLTLPGAGPPAAPHLLPDDELDSWVNSIGDRLLSSITNLLALTGTAETLDAYLSLEEGKTEYEKVNMRLSLLSALLAPSP